ncbi:hypothetical protein BN7_5743 [Wickerhamomyces ciferrii]|uniref:Uncharacterized protein n=1 Tax=Wickerhamomyces ciferrii (strain ATCC 14091 / BCRC 22168 / CBS 111 / JCM 3599 / NBRC 0793 / NRRL Y-1031 F-60-10) TaxID=1206466 RepID=K0KLL3_WICCF|nr:uncharacterized protein BN7_5743 [Wickerhamomyces ciferrii]CCH46155.1 hypothetical protein BN7_5743 [Wickerhamomyces ciferrii]
MVVHSIARRALVNHRVFIRSFSHTKQVNLNPLLPIDSILEELDNDELKKKIKAQKDQNSKGKPKVLIPAGSEDIKLKKNNDVDHYIVGQEDSKQLDAEQNGKNSSNGNGNNNGNNNKKDDYESYEEPKEESAFAKFKNFLKKCGETSGITFASLLVLGLAGVSYHKFYNAHVLYKMSNAFEKGDAAFELTMHKRTTKIEGDWVERPQQKLIDDIISGNLVGRYFLITGEKGCGKSSMILNSIKKMDSFNVTFIDAHSDPEIFRIRLGKALKFEYHEDYIGSLFSIRGPRDTTALLDIERAFNKLEEVAVRRIKQYGKPMVIVINNTHLIKDDEEGVKLVELLQQKAESLSGSGLVTMIFNSDDYWLYERLKKLGTRLEVINVRDFNRTQAVQALAVSRKRYFNENIDFDIANQVYELIGGRPQHLSEVAKQLDMIKASHKVIDREKTWFLNQCGLLGESMDDDVNESGKFSTSAMLLMRTLVEMYKEQIEKEGLLDDHKLPELPLWRARQIMTRNDFIQMYDNLNIFTIDSSDSFVRADSVPMMRGFLEIASQPGFDKLLEETLDRVGDIESLGRTREIVAKDLFLGSQYKISRDKDSELTISMKQSNNGNDDDDNDDPIEIQPVTHKGGKTFWKNRLALYKTVHEEGTKKN